MLIKETRRLASDGWGSPPCTPPQATVLSAVKWDHRRQKVSSSSPCAPALQQQQQGGQKLQRHLFATQAYEIHKWKRRDAWVENRSDSASSHSFISTQNA